MKLAAFDLGGTYIKYTVYDTEEPFDREAVQETPTEAYKGAEYVIREKIAKLIQTMGPIDGVAISTGGQVNVEEGSIIFATESMPGYTGMQVRRILEEKVHKPVYLLNDVNAAALGEATRGAGRGYPSFLCLTYGTGIGGAIVQDGEVYTGSTGSAGEFGHMLIHAGGRPCPCGGKGCYEVYGSVTALVNAVEEACSKRLNGREIIASQDDPVIHRVLENWLLEITYGLVSIAHIFNPACIVLGGGIMENPQIIERLSELYLQYAIKSYHKTVLKPAELGNCAGLLGAVAFTLDKMRERGLY